jgi:hypothetical protein
MINRSWGTSTAEEKAASSSRISACWIMPILRYYQPGACLLLSSPSSLTLVLLYNNARASSRIWINCSLARSVEEDLLVSLAIEKSAFSPRTVNGCENKEGTTLECWRLLRGQGRKKPLLLLLSSGPVMMVFEQAGRTIIRFVLICWKRQAYCRMCS